MIDLTAPLGSSIIGCRTWKARVWQGLYLLIILGFSACHSEDEFPQRSSPPDNKPELSAEQEYFLKISLGSEMPNTPERVKKWNRDMFIYVVDTSYTELMEELEQIMGEINDLSNSITLRRVPTLAESNYLIYFGDRHTYITEYEPQAASLVEENYGAFWIYWDANFRIYRGSMYVDTERTESPDCRKHLLREELTQSLGLMQDTNDHPGSIFYLPWTCDSRYADIDLQLIHWQLSNEIKAGMTRSDIIAVWQPRTGWALPTHSFH